MEKQTKHRILGIMVVIGLVIILLPFFQSGNDLATEASLVKAPPFPDQATQLASATSSDSKSVQQTPPDIARSPGHDNESAINEQPDDTISVTHPSVVSSHIPALVAPNAIAPPTPITDTESLKNSQLPLAKPEENAAPIPVTARFASIENSPQTKKKKPLPHLASAFKKAVHITQHEAPIIKVQMAALKPSALGSKDLFDLKNPVWVIQMGSFKNKINALKLVNQLRANGYPAFIQKMSTTLGENTRVFVGPANKRTAANAIASKLESDLHLRGIVISFKPLTL